MANYGKYYIAVRLLLLKQYLEANAGKDRIVARGELEEMLKEHDMTAKSSAISVLIVWRRSANHCF